MHLSEQCGTKDCRDGQKLSAGWKGAELMEWESTAAWGALSRLLSQPSRGPGPISPAHAVS